MQSGAHFRRRNLHAPQGEGEAEAEAEAETWELAVVEDAIRDSGEGLGVGVKG